MSDAAPAGGAAEASPPPPLGDPRDYSTGAAIRRLFCLDVDNTLVDNDRAKADQAAEIERMVGPERARQFWRVYEDVRAQRSVVDYPATLARFRDAFPVEPAYADIAGFLLGFPYREYVYDGAFAVVQHLNQLGLAVLLSDGDPVFQPAKIGRAGLSALVEGRVMVQPHKQAVFDGLAARWPAGRYVFVDDKPDRLAAAKWHFGERALTVLVEQGKYARLPLAPGDPAPDRRFPSIGALIGLSVADL